MRPEEIDYSDTRKHYFDISNGEILAGAAERDRYIEAGAQAIRVVELGQVLRDPDSHLDLSTADYDKVDTSDWTRDRFLDFTRWINSIVPEPPNPRNHKITTTILWNARQVGLGPGVHAIRQEFGNYTKLYEEARLGGARVVGLYDDWELEDVTAYLKKVGGDKPPTRADLRRFNKINPSNPKAGYLAERFHHIGGFYKLIELAGYTVVRNWDDEDYIAWGVRFMRANEAQPPSQSMLDYLSTKHSGPSASVVARRFDGSLKGFQAQVIRRFYEHQQEAELHDRLQLAKVSTDLDSSVVPLELFSPFPHNPKASEEDELALSQKLDSIYKNNTAGVVEAIVKRLGVKEALVRYAKFKVVDELLPQIEPATKLSISRGESNKSFMASIRKRDPMPPGDIEYAALAEGFFDDIWPDDSHLESLKLDQGYRDSRASTNEQARKRRKSRRSASLAKT